MQGQSDVVQMWVQQARPGREEGGGEGGAMEMGVAVGERLSTLDNSPGVFTIAPGP